MKHLTRLVFSADAEISERLRLPLIAIGLYSVWIAALYWYAIPAGLVDARIGGFLLIYDTAAMLGFYLLIRSGWSGRLKDPQLVLVQMTVGYGACVIAYTAAPQLRPSILYLMCVIQIFGMGNLRPKASRIAGLCAVLLLATMLAAMLLVAPPHFEAKHETLKLALTCFIIGRLSMLSHDYSAVREMLSIKQLQLAQAVTQVQELVIRDTLTGLFNRKHMQDLLLHERTRSGRTGYQFCVALIDLDHFKLVNDTYGHQIGDMVLKGFAKATQDTLRETDVICRWGGEEFLVLMRDTEPVQEGLKALERLRDKLKGMHLAEHAPGLVVTFSSGVTIAHSNESTEDMLERADQALYAAKAAGRNRCILAGWPVMSMDEAR